MQALYSSDKGNSLSAEQFYVAGSLLPRHTV
jgi:hypothetical protein